MRISMNMVTMTTYGLVWSECRSMVNGVVWGAAVEYEDMKEGIV